MQRIRRATKKHRKVLAFVVALLVVGLVGSFAMWNSNSSGSGYADRHYDDLTAVEKVDYYDNYLAENAPPAIEDADYGAAVSMGSTYITLYDLCINAYYELLNDETKTDEAIIYGVRSEEAAKTAAEYYQRALAIAPAELNDIARAQLLADAGTALFHGGDADAAGEYYAEADALAPDDINVALAYSNFLYVTQGFEAVEDYLTAFMAKWGEEDEAYLTAQSQLEWFQFYEDLNSGGDTEGAEEEAAGEEAAGEEAADDGNGEEAAAE